MFDLLHDDQQSLLRRPYRERRDRLEQLQLAGDRVQVPATYTDVDGATLLRVVGEHGLEGVVAKRLGSVYEPGRRTRAWIKTPLRHTQEVVIGGWHPGEGRRANTIGSLLLGVHDEHGQLRYAGHVGLLTGLTGDSPLG